MMESIIGLDIGTTGCKATLFDRDGAVRHQAYREYPVGAYTGSISADMIWEQVQQVIRACTAQTPEIAAICATSFGEVVVPVSIPTRRPRRSGSGWTRSSVASAST